MSEKKKSKLSFIHSTLDDYGLTPNQFRLYCHIARRGTCYESAPHMARHCKMNRDTVWGALKVLLGANLIKGQPRTGQPTIYTVTPVETWNPAENRGRVTQRKRDTTTQRNLDTTQRKIGGDHPAEKSDHKGNPISVSYEGSPNKGEGRPPKLFPRELKEALKDLKEQLFKTKPNETDKIDALIERINELEIQKFGFAVTKKPAPKVSQPDAQPRQKPEQEDWSEYIQKMKKEVADATRSDRNAGTCNDGKAEQYRNVGRVFPKEIEESVQIKNLL